jgi:methionyl-tRNA synthetase
VNGLGNLVARVMKLAETHLDAPVSLTEDDTRVETVFTDLIETFQFQQAMDLIFEHVSKGDEYMTSEEPYKKIKEPATEAQAREVITELVKHVAKIGAHLESVMPATCEQILMAVSTNTKPENLFPRLEAGA